MSTLLNNPSLQTAQIPGCNGMGDARSLGRLYAALSLGGSLGAQRLVSLESIAAFSQGRTHTDGADTGFGYGCMKLPMLMLAGTKPLAIRPGKSTFGHSGAGGTLAFADPANRLSFAYVKNKMFRLPTSTYDIVRSVYRCLSS